MLNTRWDLENLLTKIQERAQYVNKQLIQCPEGYLMQTHRDRKKVFFQVINSDDGRKRISINKKPALIDKLARKKYLETELTLLQNNITALESLLDRYADVSANDILDSLPQRYKNLPENRFFTCCDNPGEIKKEFRDWANQPYEQSTYKLWEKTHTTSRGLKMRSKSEVIIAEKLYSYGIPFRYEQMIYIEQYSFSPDFVFLTEHGLIYWEHCGKVNDPSYIRNHKWKLSMYEKLGIVPWKNLIVTYDDMHGGLDSRIIEAEIINKLL